MYYFIWCCVLFFHQNFVFCFSFSFSLFHLFCWFLVFGVASRFSWLTLKNVRIRFFSFSLRFLVEHLIWRAKLLNQHYYFKRLQLKAPLLLPLLLSHSLIISLWLSVFVAFFACATCNMARQLYNSSNNAELIQECSSLTSHTHTHPDTHILRHTKADWQW